MSNTTLQERAVLMRASFGLPGEQRQDRTITAEVQHEKKLGARAGKWDKFLYPQGALAPIKTAHNALRAFHNAVTLPFDNGIGILPGKLIPEYREKFRLATANIDLLVQEFLDKGQHWINWAKGAHNGTFDPDNYPGCKREADGSISFDQSVWAQAMREKFYVRTEPIPVPDSTHFASTVAELLGTDTESVNERVRDAAREAQSEVLKRVLEPVKHMAETLGKDKPRIYDTLITNIKDICRIAPALNLADDPELNKIVGEVASECTKYTAEELRDNKSVQDKARAAAEAMVKRLSGYKL